MSADLIAAILLGVALVVFALSFRIAERARKAEATVERYRLACAQADRWLVCSPPACNTAKWINDQGEGRPGVTIDRHRAVMAARRSL